MDEPKTKRVYAFSILDGTTKETTVASIANVLTILSEDAAVNGREVLFDTLNIKIVRESVDDSTFLETHRTSTISTVRASTEAVRRG